MSNRWWGPRSDSPGEENPLKHIRDQMPATEPYRARQTFTFDAGNAPRISLRKQVEQVLDKVDLFDDFDPRRHHTLTLNAAELTDIERNAWARRADDADDMEADL